MKSILTPCAVLNGLYNPGIAIPVGRKENLSVEVWDREWKFVGACEPSKLNEGWFLDKASKADETKPNNRIYATSFKSTETHFPMVWKRASKEVPAEDVTRRYTLRRKVTFKIVGNPGEITVRYNGRLIAQDKIANSTSFELPGDLSYEVIVARPDGEIKQTVKLSAEPGQVIEIK